MLQPLPLFLPAGYSKPACPNRTQRRRNIAAYRMTIVTAKHHELKVLTFSIALYDSDSTTLILPSTIHHFSFTTKRLSWLSCQFCSTESTINFHPVPVAPHHHKRPKPRGESQDTLMERVQCLMGYPRSARFFETGLRALSHLMVCYYCGWPAGSCSSLKTTFG